MSGFWSWITGWLARPSGDVTTGLPNWATIVRRAWQAKEARLAWTVEVDTMPWSADVGHNP